MNNNNIIQEFLTKIVGEEMVDEDNWLLTEIFYRAFPTKADYEMFWYDHERATDRTVVYDWWEEFLETAVSNSYLRKHLQDNLYDEYIYSFLNDIYDKFETHIQKHYK